MTGSRVKTFSILFITASLLSCTDFGEKGDVMQIPVDYEIGDLRNLPQDIGAYASFHQDGSLGKERSVTLLTEFRQKYYSPWTEKVSLTDFADSAATMKNFAQKSWYGENKRRVPGPLLAELQANCALEHFPSISKPAVATIATAMRVLPTTKPFFGSADDFPFDAMQNSGLKLNEPIRVLHRSRDGLWLFVETADTNGWVETRDVGIIPKKVTDSWMKKGQVVIVSDSATIRDKSGHVIQRARLGTICPLTGEDRDSWKIIVAAKVGGQGAREISATVKKEFARRFPLEFNGGSITMVGNELIGKPYGWGEKFQDRDCSAMIRDFYIPFGIWLPRGSYNQIHCGSGITLEKLKNSKKEQLIRERGVPFLTLVYMQGHIMLYVGSRNGKALMFHNIWGINVSNGRGGKFKQIIGKSIISTLNPGSELDLAAESIPDRVSKMLILGDGCAQ